MPLSRRVRLTSTLFVMAVVPLMPSCAGPSQTATSDTNTPAGATAAAAQRVAAHRAHAALPSRPLPPAITTPMSGEPTGAAASEARLVVSSCQQASSEEIEARVKAMRAAVDQQFKEWHDGQMDCWQQDREETRMRQQLESDPSGGLRPVYPRPTASFAAPTRGIAPTLSGAQPAQPQAAAPAKAASDSGRVGTGARAAPAGPAAAKSASGTNNQIASVDEADIVKTDGRYVYLAANGALRIVEALNPRVVSVTKVGGAIREIFVDGDRAVVYTAGGNPTGAPCTYGYDCTFGGDGTTTKISIFDITDRAQPRLAREMDLSGSLIAARRIGGAIHTVVSDNEQATALYDTWPPGFEMCGTMEKVVRAKFKKLAIDNERKIRARTSFASFPTLREKGTEKALCDGLLRTAIRDGQAFTTVVSFDMRDDRTAPTTATVQSRPGAVFASADALYLSVGHQRTDAGSQWYPAYPASPYAAASEASEIHKFKIGESPKTTRYVGSGLVPGHVLSQFAMDEWAGYLRVATTTGHVPDPNTQSAVSILTEGKDGNLVRVGAIDKIAPGEDIRAVRFDDDRGYVVTFKKTDPLFVLDLWQPSRPAILGELKIPGFSTYLHRIDQDHLLSIGFDANDHGDFAFFDGVILQLFDVKNPTQPKLVHKEKIGTRGSSSAAATDHLAFNYFANEGLLAIPMTICEGGGDGSNGHDLTFSGLLVYDVDIDKGFTKLGGVNHGTRAGDGAGVSCDTWWSSATSAVKRSVFLDDLVYSIASDRVKVQRMSHFGEDVADISLLDGVAP